MSTFDRKQFHALMDRCLDAAECLLEPESPGPSDRLWLPQFAVSIINDRSRVCGPRVFEAMGWLAGTVVGFVCVGDVITIGAVEWGRSVIDRRGHVRLPAEMRRDAGIEAGDPVLLVAMPEEGLVVVLGPQVLGRALSPMLAPVRDPQARAVIPLLGPREG
ncbi:AbrB/MazE/SpoVT family DNA-binding domain-containing protein [Nocardia sp. NPDC051052]|uniref:AbrB/MazE/SpoVT family DNA-binding domain-containing protein n=1 Tax=Nocardia sp. NPDC051052 TaxID=3364322 RepID=UPI0037872857